MAKEFGEYQEKQVVTIQENVSTEEYKDAVRLLKQFAEADVSRVDSIKELADVTRDIGSALRAVTISHPESTFTTGEIVHWVSEDGNSFGSTSTAAEYKLEQALGENHIWLNVRKGSIFHEQEHEIIEVRVSPPFSFRKYSTAEEAVKALFHTGYGARIFADRSLDVSGETFLWYEINAYETPPKVETRVDYYPLMQPNNREVQQNYARILQTCVSDVVSLDQPPPTDIPSGILNAFKQG